MDNDINKAKSLLKRRIIAETYAEKQLKDEIKSAFENLVGLCYNSNLRAELFKLSKIHDIEKLKQILRKFREAIFMLIYTTSQEVVKNVDNGYNNIVVFDLEKYINREVNGKTAKQRINTYTNRLEYEFESWIAAAMAVSLPKQKLVDTWEQYRTKPYTNPIFAKAVSIGEYSATRLATDGISYGVGQYTSAENALTRLARYSIEDAYRMGQFNAWNNAEKKLIGYQIGRCSSYPCQLCDDMTGFRAPQYAELPPYHARCCCWAVPVYIGEDISGF